MNVRRYAQNQEGEPAGEEREKRRRGERESKLDKRWMDGYLRGMPLPCLGPICVEILATTTPDPARFVYLFPDGAISSSTSHIGAN